MKLISLVSSGIDSPVATYLLSKYANEIILLHADNRPFTDNSENEKFVKIAKHLKTIIASKLAAVFIPHGLTLQTYKIRCDNKFTCIICKRMMLQYAEIIAKKENADAIIMGDSLGQVASQTLRNIRVVEEKVELPVLRPLIGFDKEDTIQIAKKIGTYTLSIAPTGACDAVPVKPSTQARLEQIYTEEQKINIKELLHYAIKHIKIVTL